MHCFMSLYCYIIKIKRNKWTKITGLVLVVLRLNEDEFGLGVAASPAKFKF